MTSFTKTNLLKKYYVFLNRWRSDSQFFHSVFKKQDDEQGFDKKKNSLPNSFLERFFCYSALQNEMIFDEISNWIIPTTNRLSRKKIIMHFFTWKCWYLCSSFEKRLRCRLKNKPPCLLFFVSSMSCVKQNQFEKWKKKEKENSKCFCTNWPIYCSLELLSSALRWSCIISTRKKQNKKQSPSCLEILFINLPQCNILPFLPHFRNHFL